MKYKMMIKSTFGERLADLRIAKGIKQEELAKILNVSRSAISGYENDAHYPEVKQLIKIAEFFDVSIDYLLAQGNRKLNLQAMGGKYYEDKAECIYMVEMIENILSLNDENRKRLLEYIDLLKLKQMEEKEK